MLIKGLYSLKQDANIWYECINTIIMELEFVHTSVDLCVYVRVFAPGNKEGCEPGRMIACLYMDDFLVAGKPSQ